MKLLFPIYRFNWYRTVAPVIDEALRRGHEVLCLHNEAEQFASNRPDESLLPKFGMANLRLMPITRLRSWIVKYWGPMQMRSSVLICPWIHG